MHLRTRKFLARSGAWERGMTLVEMMVACGIGCLLLTGLAMVFASSSRSFVAIGNYIEMDRSSRAAMDQMTRDIRTARNLISFSPTGIVLTDANTNKFGYNWSATSGELRQWKSSGVTNVLLAGCDSLKFTMYKHIPLAGGTNAPTTVPAEGKAISVSWKCARMIFGKKYNTEDMQQAVIVIRNKPIL